MKRKVAIIAMALIIGSTNVLMAESPAPPGAAYFIGKWAGEWEMPRGRQEAGFSIREGKDGNLYCTYSWGYFQGTRNTISPGSASGVISFENDNSMVFRKANFAITLIKKDDDTLKGRWDRIGPTDPGKSSRWEGYFKRVK